MSGREEEEEEEKRAHCVVLELKLDLSAPRQCQLDRRRLVSTTTDRPTWR